jgi:nitrate/nitrite transporter NarK
LGFLARLVFVPSLPGLSGESGSGKRQTISPEERYKFSQVFILELAYAVSFGSEIAVVSMLPEFFEKNYGITEAIAGPIAASFPLMNVVSAQRVALSPTS